MINKDTELFYDPIEILRGQIDFSKIEMTKRQLAFLCGLIKEHRPMKIVEIGIAAGGTTMVILNCASMLDIDVQLFSGDLSTQYYLDRSKATGYLVQEYKPLLNMQLRHTMYTGKYAPEYLEEIGDGIDMLIIDTAHHLPGELLDFLACYPFLHRGSIVVLHDIVLNHCSNSAEAYATKVLLDAVTAEKVLDMGEDKIFPNIGAFVINEDTGRYIDSVFSALTITWAYMPQKEELALYRGFYKKYYTVDNLELFDMAVDMQQKTLKKHKELRKNAQYDSMVKIYKWIYALASKNVYIYGCGKYGKQFYDLLVDCDIRFAGYIVSDGQNIDGVNEEIYYLSEVNFDHEKDIILISVNSSLREEVCIELKNKKIDRYMIPDDYIYDWLIK